jgi:lantibiotic modifying enzyme
MTSGPRECDGFWQDRRSLTLDAGDLKKRLLDEAVAIADRILESRILTPDGAPAWLGPTGYGSDLSPLQFTELGPNLYDGFTGIALFLAAVGHVTGRAEYADISLRALEPLRRKLLELVQAPERAARIDMPIGGLIGLGSFIYSFLKIGEIVGDPSLTRDAHEVTVLFTPERIVRDQRVRIQTGSAGAVLALLALHKVRPEGNQAGRSPLDIARECGQHLLDTRLSYEGRPKAWPLSPGKPPLLGFCYGAAGISYALLRLFEATQQPEFWDAALEGWAYVRSFYRPVEKRWTDIRALLQLSRRRWNCPGTTRLPFQPRQSGDP